MIRIMAAAAAIVLGAGAAWSAEPVNIRLGWVIAPGSIGPLLLLKPDLAKHQGNSYTLEHIHFVSTAVELVPLASGQVDIVGLSYSAIGSAIENAHLDDLRVIGDEIQDGVNGHENGSGFLVLQDGPIKTVDDLKGQVVAVLTLGSATDLQARVMLRRHHLEDKRDYSLIEAQFANMKDLLFTQKAAMVAIAPPYAFDAELRARSRMLFSASDAMGPMQLTAMVARAGFLQKNRAAMVDFLEDVIRTVRWYTDPANHMAAVALVAGFNKQPPEQLGRLFTKEDNYRDPNYEPNLAALQSNLDVQKDFGLLPTRIDLAHYVDLSLVHEAAARLK